MQGLQNYPKPTDSKHIEKCQQRVRMVPTFETRNWQGEREGGGKEKERERGFSKAARGPSSPMESQREVPIELGASTLFCFCFGFFKWSWQQGYQLRLTEAGNEVAAYMLKQQNKKWNKGGSPCFDWDLPPGFNLSIASVWAQQRNDMRAYRPMLPDNRSRIQYWHSKHWIQI